MDTHTYKLPFLTETNVPYQWTLNTIQQVTGSMKKSVIVPE